LSGTVNPNGTTVADCHFDFGTSAAYGTRIPCAQTVGSGTSDLAVSAGIGSLLPGGTYHFRVVASNLFGTSFGADQVLAMPPLAPSASTGPVAAAGLRAATLTGSVVPNGASITDCHFDYGTSTAYGSSVPCAQQVGGGNTPVQVSATLTGLTANVTYDFRLVATNVVGTTPGVDVAFTVGPAPTLPPSLSHLRLHPPRFRDARHGRRRAGTTISYRDTAPATTTFTIERCVTPRHRGRRRCPTVGSLTHVDHAGVNRLRFNGRVAGRRLAPGTYALIAVASTAGTSSQPVTARFEVIT
jgi:hypothetical protein